MNGAAEMTSRRWERIKQVFFACAELPPQERDRFLAGECESDMRLRAEVESLLAAHERPGSLLKHGAMTRMTRTARARGLITAASMEGRFLPGEVFAERFRIFSLIGRGGMGEVYRAHDLQLNQTVALKFLPSAGRDAVERFRNEVRTARQVTHPNVCRVFDIGEYKDSAYLTMEYIDGEDLGSLLLRIGRLSEDKALEIAQQICAGLQAAHDKGILHRDLKPGNVMLDGRGHARITDFGLAALAETVEGKEAGHGTPLYMSPEQLAGREATARSDIYALGLLLFEMFTGSRPFEATDVDELRELRAAAPVPQPSATVLSLAPRIERTILRCLESNTRARPASAASVAGALSGKDTSSATAANGETPTPSGLDGGTSAALNPRIALALLTVVIVGMPLVALWGNRIGWMSHAQPPASPEILSYRARNLARSVGYEVMADSVWQFVGPQSARSFTVRTVQFWYRQANCVLQPDRLTPGNLTVPPGRVSPSNPKDACPGDLNLFFDMQGKLTAMRGVAPADARDGPVDWSPLMAAAGLDGAKLRPAAPKTETPVTFDSRQAWLYDTGGSPPVRIDAASWRGVPVYLSVGEDTLASNPSSAPNLFSKKTTAPAWLGLIVSAVLGGGALILVRHNLRRHRGDRRGAFQIAQMVFCLYLLVWVFHGTHRATTLEATLVPMVIGWAMLLGGTAWVYYMAIDPYIRRRWPQMLTSLHLVLDGNAGNSSVARDILYGMAAGVGLGALYFSRFQIEAWLGGSPPMTPNPAWISGFGAIVSEVLFAMSNAVWLALTVVSLLFLFRLLLRHSWLAGSAYVLIFAAAYVPASEHPLAVLPPELLTAASIVILLFRAGVVAWLVSSCICSILFAAPISFDLSKWYAAPSVTLFAALSVVAVLAYRRALPASGVLRDEMLYR